MFFTKFDTEGDLRHFLRGCTAIGGGKFNFDTLNKGPRNFDHLVKAITQKREIVFGRDENGNGVCRSTKSETLLRVNGYQCVETERYVNGTPLKTDLDKVIRTTSETGIEGETPEATAVRCYREEAEIEIAPALLIPISRPIGEFSDPRKHESSVYRGLWRQEMKTRFLLNLQHRPRKWRTRLFIEDDDVTVVGNWWKEGEAIVARWDEAPVYLQEVFVPAEDPADNSDWQRAKDLFQSLFQNKGCA
jgi:hypothetical protein